MKRTLWLTLALAVLAVVPARAQAANVLGVVLAKDVQRKAIVTASARGAVTTARAPKLFGKLRVGQRVRARGRLLADGTLAASAVRPVGRARHVRFRAVVVRNDTKLGRLILSAGRSVFAVRVAAGSRALASDGGGLQPGDEVDCEAEVRQGSLATETGHVDEVGHVDKLELEGIYLFPSEGGFDLAVVHRGLVHVRVPAGMQLPEIGRGDEIALVVTIGADGSFTLVKLEREDDQSENGDGQGSGDGNGDGSADGSVNQIAVAGTIGVLGPTGIAVRSDAGGPPVTCAVRTGLDLSGFAVGDHVQLLCRLDGGRYLLVALKSEHGFVTADGTAELTFDGTITELSSSFVRIQPDGSRPTVRCDVPASLSLAGFAAGDRVALHCRFHDGRFWLASMKSEHAFVSDEGATGLTATGAITELGSVFVRVQPDGGQPSVRCDFNEGVSLPGFAVGDRVGMGCHFHDGRYWLAYLKSEHATLIVER